VATTIVAHDRVAGATLAESIGNVIIMDDGFQNPSLSKDLALLVVDCRRGIGNGHMIPAGPLRAPLALQLEHADAVLAVGETNGAGNVIAQANNHGLPIFRGHLEPNATALAALQDHQVLAFAGIADPGKFFATLALAGVATAATASFPDHHRYTAQEARDLLMRAEHDALRLLTTEKDLVRLQGEDDTTDLAARVTALPVTLVFEQEDAVRGLVLPLLKGRG
jgi:tetraacyldisaccharide 4'-kinase